MKLFRFDGAVGRSIEHYNSSGFTISRVAQLFDEAIVSCAHLDANGLIGYHQATSSQLFLVVQGEGWVRGETPDKTFIKTWQATYWEKGEWHESGTETGMTAIIIEGEKLEFSKEFLLE